MKSTVEPTLPGTPVPERPETINRFINKEALPLLRALRDAANLEARERVTVTTDGLGTYSRLWTSPEMPSNATWTIRASVAGTASAAGGVQHAGYLLGATFQSTAGTVTQTGSTSVLYSHESAAAIDTRFNVDSVLRTVYLESRDDAAGAMIFIAVVSTTEATR